MRALARASIRRLRSGVVPIEGLDNLSVGYERVEGVIEGSLNSLAATGRCAPLFVSGEWGTGKSHMLEFIGSAAVRRGIPQIRIDLNARCAPLNHPQRFYSTMVERVCLGGAIGLRSILAGAFADRSRRDALLQFACSGESAALGLALRSISVASREAGSNLLIDHPAWKIVLGTDLASFDYKRRHALERLTAVAKLLRIIGGSGLVMIFDEVETIDQLWNRLSRMGAYDTLGTICNMRATWAIFGITRRFDDTLQRDLDGGPLVKTVTSNARAFLHAWQKRAYQRIQVPELTDVHASTLARRVIQTYGAAYTISNADLSEGLAVLEAWKSNPGRNPRRLIRCIIDALDARRALRRWPLQQPIKSTIV